MQGVGERGGVQEEPGVHAAGLPVGVQGVRRGSTGYQKAGGGESGATEGRDCGDMTTERYDDFCGRFRERE